MVRRLRWPVLGLLLVVLGGGVALLWPETGPIVGFATVGGDPYPLAIDTQTSRAFVYNHTNSSVSTIDTATGALVRTVSAGSQFGFLSVDQRTQRVFVSSGDDTIYVLDARSGRVLHAVADGAATSRQPIVDEQSSRVFVGHRDLALLTMLDARSGTILGEIPICTGSNVLAFSQRTHHVFAKCNDGTTTMLDGRTGRVLRTTPITLGSFGWVLADEPTNRVFIINGQGAPPWVDVLDAQTGAHVRTIKTLQTVGNVVTAMVSDERTGRVYVALGGPGIPSSTARTSQVAVLDGRSGTVVRWFSVAANPTSLAVDSWRGHLLVGSTGPVDSSGQPRGDGVLSVLDSTSGVLVRRIPVGIFPNDMIIDAHLGHVLVDNETTDFSAFGSSAALTTSPPEDGWHRTKRRVLAALKGLLPAWLPLRIQVPPAPAPPTAGSVTTLDLTRL